MWSPPLCFPSLKEHSPVLFVFQCLKTFPSCILPGFIAVCSVSVIEKFHWMELNRQKTTLFNTIAIGIETVTIGREIKLISTETKGREILKH